MAMKTCPACNGDTKCKACHGNGERHSSALFSLAMVKCKKCGATGNCTRCDGKGVVPGK